MKKRKGDVNSTSVSSDDILGLRARRLRPPAEVPGRPECSTRGAGTGHQRGRDGAAAGRPGGDRDPGGGEG